MWPRCTVLLLAVMQVERHLSVTEHTECSLQHGDGGEMVADCSRKGLTSVPSSLPPGVKVLNVSDNHIADVSCDGALERYGSLQVLDVSHNVLQTVNWRSLPPSLQVIDLSFNNLTSVCGHRDTLSTRPTLLPYLRVLRLDQNKISSLKAGCFTGLGTHLQNLSLNSNQITTIVNHTFRSLQSLASLELENNEIETLQVEALAGLEGLNGLSLALNRLRGSTGSLPRGVFRPVGRTLKTLTLHGNLLGQDQQYPDWAFEDLAAVETMTLDSLIDNTGLTVFGPGFGAMANLRELDLSYDECQLKHLSNDTFAAFANSSLQSLTLSNGNEHLSTLASCAFCPLKHLSVLDLDDAVSITVTLEDLFSSFYAFTRHGHEVRAVRAKRFLLHNNGGRGQHLTERVMRFVHGTCLRELYLSQNGIISIERNALIRPGSRFTACVRRLDLSENNLIYVDVSFLMHLNLFTELRSLEVQQQETLSLYKAQIVMRRKKEIVDEREFTQGYGLYFPLPPNIQLLNVSAVIYSLGFLPHKLIFTNASNLEIMDISFIQQVGCTSIMVGLENVRNLNLSGSNCRSVSSSFFDQFLNLRTLTLQNMAFHPHFFKREGGDQLFRNLTELQWLDLSFNDLEMLHPELLNRQRSLRQLILLENKLERMDLSLEFHEQLHFLDLSSNRLSSLNDDERRSLDSLVARQQEPLRLHLQGNPLVCTCATLDFVRWLGETRVVLDKGGDYPCLTENGEISSTRTVAREWPLAWRRCVGPTALWASGALMMLLLSLMGAVWAVGKNLSRLHFFFTVIRRIRMPVRTQFHRDAYVTYCDADILFIIGRLKRELQDRRGVRLLIKDLPVDAGATCFYQLPGDNVALKMLEHIDLCWKVILVLTPDLIHDNMVGFTLRAVLQSITDCMPQRVVILHVGMMGMPKLASLQPLLEAVPENQVLSLPYSDTRDPQLWDSIAHIILK